MNNHLMRQGATRCPSVGLQLPCSDTGDAIAMIMAALADEAREEGKPELKIMESAHPGGGPPKVTVHTLKTGASTPSQPRGGPVNPNQSEFSMDNWSGRMRPRRDE